MTLPFVIQGKLTCQRLENESRSFSIHARPPHDETSEVNENKLAPICGSGPRISINPVYRTRQLHHLTGQARPVSMAERSMMTGCTVGYGRGTDKGPYEDSAVKSISDQVVVAYHSSWLTGFLRWPQSYFHSHRHPNGRVSQQDNPAEDSR